MFLLFLIISSSCALPLEHLYPFGPDNGDSTWPKVRNHQDLDLQLDIPFPFFGEIFNDIAISNHGVVSFGGRTINCPGTCSLYSEKTPMIAVLLIANDNRGIGEIYYRSTRDSEILYRVQKDVCKGFINKCHKDAFNWALVVTWNKVTPWGGNSQSPQNTFQLIAATNGRESYAIFNYNNITWTKTSDLWSQHNAIVGFVGKTIF